MYLTNEVFLYRVVSVLATPDGALVELEDCFHLDVVRVPLADVRARQLRVVTPAHADDRAQHLDLAADHRGVDRSVRECEAERKAARAALSGFPFR